MQNPFLPRRGKLVEIRDETPNIRTFRIKLDEELRFDPGQFVEISVFGVGEAPFAISSSPFQTEFIEITVMRVGGVTSALHSKKAGDLIGVRGPYGNGFPVRDCEGMDITVVGGGVGMSPLRSLIYYLMHERGKYGDVKLLYGARTPRDLVFRKELEEWKDVDVHLTVDVGDDGWKGNVGVVTTLFNKVKIDPTNNAAFVCGPPIAMKFITLSLLQVGFDPKRIYLSLERMMKCGIGKCGHCNIERYYVCKDGPVFTYEQVKDLPRLWA